MRSRTCCLKMVGEQRCNTQTALEGATGLWECQSFPGCITVGQEDKQLQKIRLTTDLGLKSDSIYRLENLHKKTNFPNISVDPKICCCIINTHTYNLVKSFHYSTSLNNRSSLAGSARLAYKSYNNVSSSVSVFSALCLIPNQQDKRLNLYSNFS